MNVELKLIVLHVNLQTKLSACLLQNEQLISCPLLNNIDSGLRDILVEYLDIEPDWVRFNLVDVIEEENSLAIIYGCVIPYVVKQKKGVWTKLGDIDDNKDRQLVFEASQKITI